MENSWANSGLDYAEGAPPGPETSPVAGLDVHMQLPGPRVRAALEAARREGVQTGRLRAGMRLRASRTLAAGLGIARNTVADAYGQLVAEGWLTARQGSGTRVAEHTAAWRAPPEPDQAQPSPPRYSLRTGLPDLTTFPRTALLAAATQAAPAAPPQPCLSSAPRQTTPLAAS